jgi:hypothetical protein
MGIAMLGAMGNTSKTVIAEWLRDALAASQKSQSELSRELCRRQRRTEDHSIVNKVLAFRRDLRFDEIMTISAIAGVAPPPIADRHLSVPMFGVVEAGAKITPWNTAGQAELFPTGAPMPDGGNDKTVALEVKGDALGSAFEGWLAYFHNRRSPPSPDLGRLLCAVELEDGSQYVRKVSAGSSPGRFNLWGSFGDPMLDVQVAWAEPIFAMLPKPSAIDA